MELNLLNFSVVFPNEEACYEYIIKKRWPSGMACLTCGSVRVYASKTRRMFKCGDCYRQFTPLTGTIFQDTHLPLRKWFMAAYLLSEEGMSSTKLAEKLRISQRSAWFLAHRLRLAMTERDFMLDGTVQMDETYVGPKVRGRTTARYSSKYAVLGAVEKGKYGRIKLEVVKQPDATVAMDFIRKYIKLGTLIHTDESRIYWNLRYTYDHQTVNHSKRQYVFEGITSNKIENAWSHLKRLIRGRHIRVSGKHLPLYAREFQFRYNTRSLTVDERFNQLIGQGVSQLLPYNKLVTAQAVPPLALRGWARKRAAMPAQLSLGL